MENKKDIDYDDRKKFLEELTVLSKKYSLVIQNKCCGCDPYLVNAGADISESLGYKGYFGIMWIDKIK